MRIIVLCNDCMAVPALSSLLQQGKVVAVGMPCSMNETQPVVQALCNKAAVPFMLFSKGSLGAHLEKCIKELQADVVLVKTFPWKVPAAVLNMPRFGFINFHYAPLPEFRGPNPLFWIIKNGVGYCGITVHQMTAQFDEGAIILSSKVQVDRTTTMGMLCTQLAYGGVELTGKLLHLLAQEKVPALEQDASKAVWYLRPQPQDLWVKWDTMNADAIERLVCACNPWNKGAAISLNGWTLGLSYVTPLREYKQNNIPGTILALDDVHGLRIACAGSTVLRADVIYTEEGFMPGFVLNKFSIQTGMRFV